MPYQPEGDPLEAEYIFIGEAPAEREMLLGRPLVGPSGHVFDECLQKAGIPRGRCYLTNVFNDRVRKDKLNSIYCSQTGELLYHYRTGLTSEGEVRASRLDAELDGAKANIIVPMGNPALQTICGKRGIAKHRGSIYPSVAPTTFGKKCIPSLHPATALHGSFLNRYIITYDFRRVRREREFSEIRRPPYRFVNSPTYSQCIDILDWFKQEKPQLSVDTEAAHRQVSRICFAWSRYDSISIPLGDGGWSLEQEAMLWRKVAEVLEDPDIPKIFQNAAFDIWFLFFVHRVLVQGQIDDTMIAHHIMYPDFSKGLAFMTSVYTDQPYYKDMVKHGEVAKAGG